MSNVSAEAALSAVNFCHSHREKYLLLLATGGSISKSHRMMEPEDDARILRYYRRGWKKAKIARRMGVDHCTVTNRLKRMGVI